MAGPGHQIAPQGIQFFLLLVGLLELLRHLVEGAGQQGDLIIAADFGARG